MNATPICCNRDARFVDNGPNMQYFFCDECRNEVLAPTDLQEVKETEEDLRSGLELFDYYFSKTTALRSKSFPEQPLHPSAGAPMADNEALKMKEWAEGSKHNKELDKPSFYIYEYTNVLADHLYTVFAYSDKVSVPHLIDHARNKLTMVYDEIRAHVPLDQIDYIHVGTILSSPYVVTLVDKFTGYVLLTLKKDLAQPDAYAKDPPLQPHQPGPTEETLRWLKCSPASLRALEESRASALPAPSCTQSIPKPKIDYYSS